MIANEYEEPCLDLQKSVHILIVIEGSIIRESAVAGKVQSVQLSAEAPSNWQSL